MIGPDDFKVVVSDSVILNMGERKNAISSGNRKERKRGSDLIFGIVGSLQCFMCSQKLVIFRRQIKHKKSFQRN